MHYSSNAGSRSPSGDADVRTPRMQGEPCSPPASEPEDRNDTTMSLSENAEAHALLPSATATTADATGTHDANNNSSNNDNNNNEPAAHPVLHDSNLSILLSSYKRDYPTVEELAEQIDGSGDTASSTSSDSVKVEVAHRLLEEKLHCLRSDVAALREETMVLSCHVDDLRQSQEGQNMRGVGGGGNGSCSVTGASEQTRMKHRHAELASISSSHAASNASNNTNNNLSVSNANNSIVTFDAHDPPSHSLGAPHAAPPQQQQQTAVGVGESNRTGNHIATSRSNSTLFSSTVQTVVTPISSIGRQRGRVNRGRTERSMAELFLSVEDKVAMLARERKRLEATQEQHRQENAEMWAQLRATVVEAERRLKELRLEALHLKRDVHLELTLEKKQAGKAGAGKVGARGRRTTPLDTSAPAPADALRDSHNNSDSTAATTTNTVAESNGDATSHPSDSAGTELIPLHGGSSVVQIQASKDDDPDSHDNSSRHHNSATSQTTAAAIASYALSASSPTTAPALIVSASAEELQRYLNRRRAAHDSYLDKLHAQSDAAAQDILRVQQQLRQRRAAGEAFSTVDFELLQIENQQSSARLEERKAAVVQLKGISTRTVQSLNSLLDTLHELTSEQTRLRAECQSRAEYLTRCRADVELVSREAVLAERRHDRVKAQHEAVRVPKIEEYIAQKAEMYELEQALKNWSRKAEIAEGRARSIRQQTHKLTTMRDCATTTGVAARRTRSSGATGKAEERWRRTAGSSGGSPAAATARTVGGSRMCNLVGNGKRGGVGRGGNVVAAPTELPPLSKVQSSSLVPQQTTSRSLSQVGGGTIGSNARVAGNSRVEAVGSSTWSGVARAVPSENTPVSTATSRERRVGDRLARSAPKSRR